MTDAPTGSNADEWELFLSEWGTAYCAVQIAEAIEAAEQFFFVDWSTIKQRGNLKF